MISAPLLCRHASATLSAFSHAFGAFAIAPYLADAAATESRLQMLPRVDFHGRCQLITTPPRHFNLLKMR